MKTLKLVALYMFGFAICGFVGTTIGKAVGKAVGETETAKIIIGDMQYICDYEYILNNTIFQKRTFFTTNGKLRNLKTGYYVDIGLRVMTVFPHNYGLYEYSFVAKHSIHGVVDVYCHKG